MTSKEMNELVATELAHIPKWPGEHQNMLRCVYNFKRRASLGRKVAVKRSANEVLQDCIAEIRQSNPAVQVRYDKGYFEGK